MGSCASTGSDSQPNLLRFEIEQTKRQTEQVRQQCDVQRSTVVSTRQQTEGFAAIKNELEGLQQSLRQLQSKVRDGKKLISLAAEEDAKTAKLRENRIVHKNKTVLVHNQRGGGGRRYQQGYPQKVVEDLQPFSSAKPEAAPGALVVQLQKELAVAKRELTEAQGELATLADELEQAQNLIQDQARCTTEIGELPPKIAAAELELDAVFDQMAIAGLGSPKWQLAGDYGDDTRNIRVSVVKVADGYEYAVTFVGSKFFETSNMVVSDVSVSASSSKDQFVLCFKVTYGYNEIEGCDQSAIWRLTSTGYDGCMLVPIEQDILDMTVVSQDTNSLDRQLRSLQGEATNNFGHTNSINLVCNGLASRRGEALHRNLVLDLASDLYRIQEEAEAALPGFEVDVREDDRAVKEVEVIKEHDLSCWVVASMVYPPNGRDGFKLYDTLSWGDDGKINLVKEPIRYEAH